MAATQTLNFQDMFLRSRKTILEMMAFREYNTLPYEKLSGSEVLKLASGSPEAVEMQFEHKSSPDKKAIVKYSFKRIKTSLNREIANFVDPESETYVDSTQTEIVYILMEELADAFHIASRDAWLKHKLKIQFFWMPTLVCNPMHHQDQPKFELLPQSDHQQFMKDHYITSIRQLPAILYSDIIARYMGIVPGDIVKITRSSPASGEYILYRVCLP